jgi:ubiquinone biosynthesis protein
LLYKALDNAAHAQQRAELQQREFALLRLEIANQKRSQLWAILTAAMMVCAAIWFK